MHHAFAPIAPIHFGSPKQATTSPHVEQVLQKNNKQRSVKLIVKSASIPSFTEETAESSLFKGKPNFDPGYSIARSFLQWHRDNESALSWSQPLPLPMTYPGSAPVYKDVENMKNCDPEIKDCREVIYQWTGECSRCQGTGDISYHKRKGREVICECMACLGLGHVHKVTMRTDIDIVEEV